MYIVTPAAPTAPKTSAKAARLDGSLTPSIRRARGLSASDDHTREDLRLD
jgi:hypothetical protein